MNGVHHCHEQSVEQALQPPRSLLAGPVECCRGARNGRVTLYDISLPSRIINVVWQWVSREGESSGGVYRLGNQCEICLGEDNKSSSLFDFGGG